MTEVNQLWSALILCIVLSGGFAFALIRLRRWYLRLPLIPVLIVLILFGGLAGLRLRWSMRVQPPDLERELSPGIVYRRRSFKQPRPFIVHTIRIKLGGPSFLVTPADSPGPLPLRARTVSAFLKEFDQDLAIAGDFFAPWYYRNLIDYYPGSGDPVTSLGPAASGGVLYARAPFHPTIASLALGRDNRARIVNRPPAHIYNLISGQPLLAGGAPHPNLFAGANYYEDSHPRAAVGLDQSGDTMVWMVVDGRQPRYSEGVTMSELAWLMQKAGVDSAINLDGGGSVALVRRAPDGEIETLNSPIHGYPGNQRPVANHLGLKVRPE